MFKLQDQKYIPLLDLNAQIYNESQFNCKHVHLDSDSDEMVFMVAFRTIPEDSTGVAHILEHTALCGSKKYPVRDPFFMMIRRSLNTFMNAFTSSDWTAYPFATLNKKDFDNLLGVYLDSAFFPNLDSLDFAQEGHRLEFKDKKNIKSELEIKGVVFNEMKGAMSSITSQLWHGMSRHLYSSSTYKHNSGGDPEEILDLTHNDLVDFHKKHYHPSNATFFTFGKIDPTEIQEFIKTNVLSCFEPSSEKLGVQNEDRLSSPKIKSDFYNPLPGDEDNHHVVISWLLNESHNPVELLETYLMSNILLDNSASPLRKALESSSLGKSPSPLTGLEADQKELVFAAGLEGVSANKHQEVENLIVDCLKKLISEGIPKELVDSSLHQLEIRQREITGSGMPFGLQIMLTCLPACIHNDDPLNILDLDNAFNIIKERLEQDNYIESLIEKNLINNNHKLNYSLIPDTNFNKKNDDRIYEKIRNKTRNLTEDDKNKIIDLAQALETRQEAIDDPETLPKVTKEDIPASRKYPIPSISSYMDIDNYYYKSGTNGLVYHTMLFPCDSLSDKELQISSLYASSLTDVGLGSDSYEQIQKYQSSITGGLSASFVMIPNEHSSKHMLALKVSGKSLEKNAHLMHELILKTVNEANLDDKKRIKELLSFISADNEQSLTQNGHILAMANAAAQITPEASTNDLTSGIRFINNTGILSKDAENSENLDIYIKNLKSIQSKISSAPKYIFTASSLEEEELNLKLSNAENAITVSDQKFVSIQNDSVGWITGSQVCFCAEAFPSVESSHEDAPALSILGAVLRNGYLHSAIREKGGAYGSGAMQDSNNKVFKFFSYRDPKCSETFTEFNNARQWSLSNITEAHLDEGILGVISSIDKPMSPYGEAVSDFMSELDHKKQKDRLLFRNRVKECTVSDLVRVSKKYLFSESKKSVIAGENFQDEIQKMGFKLKNI